MEILEGKGRVENLDKDSLKDLIGHITMMVSVALIWERNGGTSD